MRTNKFIVFTGPSGVGKATIEKILFDDKELNLRLSCSATTRNPREGEVDGVHYHFLSKEEFNKRIKEDAFVEWNEHFSNKYGTLKSEIKRIQANGEVPFLELETNGAMNVIKQYGESEIVSFFISPPSLEALEKRISGRGTEDADQVKERLDRVHLEFSFRDKFHHQVINDSVERAAKEIKEILLKEL